MLKETLYSPLHKNKSALLSDEQKQGLSIFISKGKAKDRTKLKNILPQTIDEPKNNLMFANVKETSTFSKLVLEKKNHKNSKTTTSARSSLPANDTPVVTAISDDTTLSKSNTPVSSNHSDITPITLPFLPSNREYVSEKSPRYSRSTYPTETTDVRNVDNETQAESVKINLQTLERQRIYDNATDKRYIGNYFSRTINTSTGSPSPYASYSYNQNTAPVGPGSTWLGWSYRRRRRRQLPEPSLNATDHVEMFTVESRSESRIDNSVFITTHLTDIVTAKDGTTSSEGVVLPKGWEDVSDPQEQVFSVPIQDEGKTAATLNQEGEPTSTEVRPIFETEKTESMLLPVPASIRKGNKWIKPSIPKTPRRYSISKTKISILPVVESRSTISTNPPIKTENSTTASYRPVLPHKTEVGL